MFYFFKRLQTVINGWIELGTFSTEIPNVIYVSAQNFYRLLLWHLPNFDKKKNFPRSEIEMSQFA